MLSLENLKQKAAEFGETFVAPYTESIDKEARFPKEAYDELKKQGFMGLLVPKEYGGSGGSCIHHALVLLHFPLLHKDRILYTFLYHFRCFLTSHQEE